MNKNANSYMPIVNDRGQDTDTSHCNYSHWLIETEPAVNIPGHSQYPWLSQKRYQLWLIRLKCNLLNSNAFILSILPRSKTNYMYIWKIPRKYQENINKEAKHLQQKQTHWKYKKKKDFYRKHLKMDKNEYLYTVIHN